MAQQCSQTDEVVPLHRLEVSAPHRLPFAIGTFDTIGPLSRAAFPHRHTFYEIVHVASGSGSHVVDLRRLPLGPPQLGVIVPGQVHFWERISGLRGWVVLFEDAFLLAHPQDRAALHRLGAQPWLRLADGQGADVVPVLEEMHREYQERRPGLLSVLQSYLHILVVRATRLLDVRGDPAGEPPALGRPAAIAEQFTQLLAGPGELAGRPVRDWAAELGVSASYLNEAVRGALGRTPARLIRETQVLEAKRLLASTTLTVRRVAREVGFADPAYFCRFFRREVGATPGQFRREAVGNHHGHRTASIDGRTPSP
jgi:AraC-like DNA-binding protein